MELSSLVGGSSEVIGPEATLEHAAQTIIKAGIGSLAVVDGRTLAGIITERDIVRAVAEGADLGAAVVKDWMTESPDTVGPEVEAEDAATWMLEMGYRHLPVMENDELLGVVSIRDLLWALTSGG
ncbi:MAG: CBS domain-containing protein [Acidimicrobiia bacterium]|nr:CBS domain-containing protein [Acidimicrobiia bacterium]MDH3471112.1 CBS domain-containing protein [Acidimicrobiia bacterium]